MTQDLTKAPADLIDSMCLTWRHDFGLVRGDATHAGYYGIGMTEAERGSLRNSMRQIWEHCIAPYIAASAPSPAATGLAAAPKKLFIREMNRLLDAKGAGGCPDIPPPDGWDRECVKCAFKWRQTDWGVECPVCEVGDDLDAEAFAKLKSLLAAENDPDRKRRIVSRIDGLPDMTVTNGWKQAAEYATRCGKLQAELNALREAAPAVPGDAVRTIERRIVDACMEGHDAARSLGLIGDSPLDRACNKLAALRDGGKSDG